MNFKTLFLIATAASLAILSGCAGRSAATTAVGNSSRPTANGLKSPAQVAPCCRPLAEGRISLDRCMENPACIANNRSCCMNAF